MLSILLFILFIVFVFLRIPVAMAIGLATFIACAIGGYNFLSIPQQMAASVRSVPLLAVPFFILAGNLMNNLGLTKKIFNFAESIAGWMKGALAHANVLASMIFAGISGAALADIGGLGVVEIKAMNDAGYDKNYSAAITVASSVVGPIIPPSIMMIIYAIMADISIARLFLAGLFPGVVIGLSLMFITYILVITGRWKVPPPTKWSIRRVLFTLKEGILAVGSPIIILAGMVSGIVTPTEAGVLAISYAVLLGFIYRTISVKSLIPAFKESILSTALIMYIIAVASAMQWVLTMEGTPMVIGGWLTKLTTNKYFILLIINLFLLLLGCILETLPAMLMVIPILLPIADMYQISRIHLGIILIFNLLIGIMTPPMGIGLYTMSAVANVKFEPLVKASVPFIIALLGALAVISYIPQICLFIPNLLMP